MKQIFLALLFLLSAGFCQDASRPFAGISFGAAKIEPFTKQNGDRKDYSYLGDLQWELNGGYEFRVASWFRPRLYLLIAGNGWDWEYGGHSGSVSYLYPALGLDIDFHIVDRILLGLGYFYGKSFDIGAEYDGRDNLSALSGYSYHASGFSYHIGYKINAHWRVLFGQQSYNIGSDKSNVYYDVVTADLRAQYVF
jgi:hypothetical protein